MPTSRPGIRAAAGTLCFVDRQGMTVPAWVERFGLSRLAD
ncbi:hypothetical protein DB30_02734 [Enhygromyxa salina]|uniref:Uncharacterized protein n=1 Tax=Enhygromyxa salina TaxID=215803 RepID=A0A0C2A7F6_9BACT|nr:hypothetical protein DB30_02734 [Enhygromyxa salina]